MVSRLVDPPAFAPGLSPCQTRLLIGLAGLAAGLTLLLCLSRSPILPDDTARGAASDMLDGLAELRAFRAELGLPVDTALDPAGSGLVGVEYTDLTTTLGDLRAKQTSLNPQFAALLVMWLQKLDLTPGDKVAICCTGSFPALNMAALYACQALDLQPLSVSSVGASSYGANLPGFTWLDMEKRLYDTGHIRQLSQYISLGGIVETGGGMDGNGFELGEAAIARHGGVFLDEGGPLEVAGVVAGRMDLYTADGLPKAFINVGGGLSSLGWVSEAALLDNGLLSGVPRTSNPQRGAIFRLHELGVPIIHLLNIERLAAENLLPIAPARLSPELDFVRAWRIRSAWLVLVVSGWFGVGAYLLRRQSGFSGHTPMPVRSSQRGT